MYNRNNPFQAMSKEGFDKNIKTGRYHCRKSTMNKLSLECLTLILMMLQHEEADRISIDDILRHPYILRNTKSH